MTPGVAPHRQLRRAAKRKRRSLSTEGTAQIELAAEQQYVTGLHRRLDDIRAHVVHRLDEALASSAHNPQAVGEREAAVQLYTQRNAPPDAPDPGLSFRRLDPSDDVVPRYIGRIGLNADDGREEPLLVDWRAPAAQPFYTATPLHDLGVRRRRHLRTRGRTVVSLTDETLDLDDPDVAERSGLVGESVLLAALNATRTGRMTDIVRTIQAEQDRIIRADSRGVLVVQGGPGTGKTAVALHRAAYLLYTHRERLARSGLLIVGPSPTFLRYIADVLPSLGETGVVLADLGGLRPGLHADAVERPEVAEVKGRLGMAEVITAAVRNRQAVLDKPVQLEIDGTPLRFTKADAARARSRARTPSRLHNEARPAFARAVIELVTRKYADKLGENVLGGANLLGREDVAALRREVAGEPAGPRLIDRLWPRLTAERLVRELFASPEQLAAATRGWRDADRDLLHRPGGSPPPARPAAPRRASPPWTPADAPLLEGAEELLGVDDSAERAAARRERQRRRQHAQETLDLLHGSRSLDNEREEESEELTAGDLLDAEGLAERQEEADTPLDGRTGRRRPHVDLRARHRRRGTGALGDGLAAAAAPLSHPLDDRRRRCGADRLPGRRVELAGGPGAAPGRRVAAGRAHGQLPAPRRDHGGGRGGPRCGRDGRDRGSLRAFDRRTPVGARGCRGGTGGRGRRGRGGTGQGGRHAGRCRPPQPAGGRGRGGRGAAPGHGARAGPGPDRRSGGPAARGRQGPGVRLGARRRPARDPRRGGARAQRPLRRAHPGHPAARRRPPRRPPHRAGRARTPLLNTLASPRLGKTAAGAGPWDQHGGPHPGGGL